MQDRKPDLILASPQDAKRYTDARSYSGLPDTLSVLAKHPLALDQRGKPRGYDHIHLSVSSRDKHLVRWSGRAANGYHYQIGEVMVILNAAEQLGLAESSSGRG